MEDDLSPREKSAAAYLAIAGVILQIYWWGLMIAMMITDLRGGAIVMGLYLGIWGVVAGVWWAGKRMCAAVGRRV